MLTDHVFHFLSRSVTVTASEQLMAILVLVIGTTAWVLQQFRRKRVVAVQRSAVSDHLLYELSRIADSLERIANRPLDQVIAAANRKAEGSREIPLSMFGRERPQS